MACVLDLLYLLLAYALLRTPLTEELRLVLPVVVAATIVTAIAALVWLVLVVRMQVLAGAPGILLGLLLGAPLLLSLPLLDGRIVGDVPTIASSAVAWVVGIGLLLLLVGIRSRLNHYSRAALGGRLDRGLLGTYAANDELAHARRQSAFGRIVGALIDVVLLVLAYWIVARAHRRRAGALDRLRMDRHRRPGAAARGRARGPGRGRAAEPPHAGRDRRTGLACAGHGASPCCVCCWCRWRR